MWFCCVLARRGSFLTANLKLYDCPPAATGDNGEVCACGRPRDVPPPVSVPVASVPVQPFAFRGTTVSCEFCNATFWYEETDGKPPTKCCHKGKVQLPRYGNPPPFLMSLLTQQDAASRHFRHNIRSYNNIMQIASSSIKVRNGSPHVVAIVAVHPIYHRSTLYRGHRM
jgi:hypothetical protein